MCVGLSLWLVRSMQGNQVYASKPSGTELVARALTVKMKESVLEMRKSA